MESRPTGAGAQAPGMPRPGGNAPSEGDGPRPIVGVVKTVVKAGRGETPGYIGSRVSDVARLATARSADWPPWSAYTRGPW